MTDIQPLRPLDDLARQINAEHAEVMRGLRATLEHARAAGDLLLEARGQCAYGTWLPWLKENVAFSERTAQGYMQVARRWPELEARLTENPRPVADFGLRDALAILAGDSEPPALPASVSYTEAVTQAAKALRRVAEYRETLRKLIALFEEVEASGEHAVAQFEAEIGVTYADVRERLRVEQDIEQLDEEFEEREATEHDNPHIARIRYLSQQQRDLVRQYGEQIARLATGVGRGLRGLLELADAAGVADVDEVIQAAYAGGFRETRGDTAPTVDFSAAERELEELDDAFQLAVTPIRFEIGDILTEVAPIPNAEVG